MTVSLAGRMSAFFLAALAALLAVAGVAVVLLARAHLRRDLDDRLADALDAVAAAAEVEPDRVEWRPELKPRRLAGPSGGGPVVWAVFDDRGEPVDGSATPYPAGLPNAPGGDGNGRHFATFADRDGRRWRVARLPLRPVRPDPAARRAAGGAHGEVAVRPRLDVLAAAPTAPVDARLAGVAGGVVGLSAGLWLLAAACGRRVGRRALRPVADMARAARAMSADGRSRLPAPGTGDELDDLAESFNGLLGRLGEALERRARFAGDASHQLRTPLAGLLGQIEVALRRDRPADEYRRVLDQLHGEALRLQRIVEALLFLARAESDAARPELGPVDLADWVPAHLARWSTHPRAADLAWHPPAPGDFRTRAHQPLLGQLLDNLLDNACKYSDPGAPIGVAVGRDDGSVVLAVEDRGVGVAPEDLPHLFDPFYRGPGARRRGAPGVGLGLAVVRRIAATFGGEVRAEPAPDGGSRFVVRLPCVVP